MTSRIPEAFEQAVRMRILGERYFSQSLMQNLVWDTRRDNTWCPRFRQNVVPLMGSLGNEKENLTTFSNLRQKQGDALMTITLVRVRVLPRLPDTGPWSWPLRLFCPYATAPRQNSQRARRRRILSCLSFASPHT
ncbi:hypothetical protein Mapa_017730 [Marchantia paleacea]|nr:hypothetical protein Mapa_017730 [Marchantia paleacea]